MNILVSVKWQSDLIQTFHLSSKDLSKKTFSVGQKDATFSLPKTHADYKIDLVWQKNNQIFVFDPYYNESYLLTDKPIVVQMGDFYFKFEENKEESRYPINLDKKGIGGFCFSTFIHSVLLLIFFTLTPPFEDAEANSMNSDQLYYLRQLLNTEAEKDLKPMIGSSEGISQKQEENGSVSKESGIEKNNTNSKISKLQSLSNWEDLGRGEILQDISSFGMISVLSGLPNEDLNKWNSKFSNGNDPFGIPNSLDKFELGGLNIGQNGNDKLGGGIHLNGISSLNCFSSNCINFPNLNRKLKHNSDSPPKMRAEPITSLEGRLPADVIQRVIRQNFGRFRFCYENGLKKNPGMSGRVVINFVIGRDGSVGSASASASGVDPGVTSCIVSAVRSVSFPSPDGGTVRVSYPLALSPN